ncbi:unnamed protein product (macronuclear) [Paramecium tetraurelia]|uniref:Uncharacterized protein n=1 Tax=Paramecium tetraurelia TaxID=5888 RepID=A0CCX6_PARTE|nr:uncharacterized protein GSPATT00037428001 [Paramecium tetraurelia]CAK68643.1 unnamed protein product [Paramecium tetraurelia]|eukprot:XP_001436040.1 hypothetical protein (macronuclear) [Paramecium tetraurelia strain d4-2]
MAAVIITYMLASKLDKISIFPTTNEILTWQIKSEFFDGADLTYTLSDSQQKEFQIIHPFEQTGRDSSHKNVASNIVAAKAARISSSGFWLNMFAFLDQSEDEVYLNIAEGSDVRASPYFNQRYLVTKRNNSEITCFDVDFTNTQQYIVDCQKQVVQDDKIILQNIFFVLSKDGTKNQVFTEKAIFQTYKQRFLGQYTVTNALGITHQYLFRVTPAYAVSLDSELASDSLVEVYLISASGEPQNTNFVLDKAVLADTLGVPKIDFSLVDFSVQPNGDIYLLDAFNGLYIVKYLPNGEWEVQNIVYPRTGQAFAFSVNSFIKEDESLAHVIVVQGYNYFIQIENMEFKYIYDLPFIQLEYPAYIKLSQENVIIRNEHTLYLYNIDTENVQLNSRYTLSQKDIILLNPYLPDLVVISNLLSKRYTLSMGHLKYMGSTGAKAVKDIILTAYAPNEQKCSITISYQILNDRDPQIYKLANSAHPFPKTLVEGDTHQQLQSQASGPNIQYKLGNKELEDTQIQGVINKRWVLKKDSIVWPTNVVYADVLVLEKQTQFYQIIQTDDLKLQIWLCDHPSIFEQEFNCQKIVSGIDLKVTVNKQTFTLWRHDLNNIYFMYKDTDFSVIIKYYYAGELKVFKQLTYDKTDPMNKIKSLFFADNYFFIIKADDTILAYSTYDHENHVLAIADANTFKPYGYSLNWKPQRLFGNRKLHPNLIFVVNQDNIVLVDFHYKFTFLQEFAFKAGLEAELAIAEDTFFIVYGQSTQGARDGFIEEYDFSRLNNIFKIKTLQLYWYQITSPLTVDQSEENGRLFVRAYCKYSKKAHILVFTPDTLQHDTLFDAWSISNENIPDDDKIVMAVDGDQQMFLYTYVDGQTTLVSEMKNSVMTLKVNLDNAMYNSNMNLNLIVSNYDYPDEPFNTVKIQDQVQLINTQSIIEIDNTKFDLFKSGVILNSNSQQKNVELGTQWFSGQLVGIDLECEQCENHIIVQNILETNNPKFFNGFEIREVIKYNDDANIFVATKGLIFTHPDNTLMATYHFDLPSPTYRCYQAQVSSDKLLIYTLCEDKGQYSIYVTGCLSVTGCSPLGEKFKIEQASKIQLIDNDIMVVLHTDNFQYSDVDGRIVIYQLKKGLKTWNLEVLDVIATQTLNSQLESPLEYFRPSDFTVIKQYQNQDQTLYKIIISNSKNGLVFYDFTLTNMRYQFQSVESVDLYNYLNYEVNQYAFSNTHFLQVRLTEHPTYDKDQQQIQLQLLIQTSNAAHYGISFTFKKQDKSASTKINSKQLDFVLNRYSNWPSINKIATNGNYIAIPYFNDNALLVGLYKKSASIPTTIISGTYLQYIQGQHISPLNMALFFDLSNEKSLYASELSGPLKSYALLDSPIITFNNQNGDLKNQTVTVFLQNDFNIEKTQFKLEVRPIDLNECRTKITNIQIYPSTTEVMSWQLSNGIFEGVGLKYTIEDNQDFTIIQPITQISSSQHCTQVIGQVSSIKAQWLLREWNGHFAFLDYSTATNGLYYTKVAAMQNQAPSFSEIVYVDPEAPTIKCFDFDYLNSESADNFIIDCQLDQQQIIYIIKGKTINSISKIKSQFTTNKLRWFNRLPYDDASYYLRVTPAFSITEDGSVGKVSQVELFHYDGQEITLHSTIDNAKFAQLLKKDKIDFMLVDYKVYNDGTLYLLDQKLGIIKLQYNHKDKDWKLLDQINFTLQQYVAFDIDDYVNEKGQSVQHIVVLSYNYFFVLENKVIVKVIDLGYFATTYPQQIQISQRNIFIQHDNAVFVYGFNDESITLLDKQAIVGGYSVDKIKDEFIAIGQKESNLYFFSQGALKYEFKSGQIKDGEVKIVAKSLNNQQCQSNIKYSIIKSDDSKIYKITESDAPFPPAADENTVIDLGELTSGPNQKYEAVYETTENNCFMTELEAQEQIRIVQNTKFEAQGQPSNILFQTSIFQPKQSTIFKIFQLKDKSLALYQSDPKLENNIYKFTQVGTIKDITVELNDQTFSIWQVGDVIVRFATAINEYKINLYSFNFFMIELLKTISFEEKEGQQIVSILNQGEYLFILQKNGVLHSYQISKFSFVNKVTGNDLIGYGGQWMPIKLYGNRVLKSNIVFVQNENNIVLINYFNTEFIFVKQMDYTKGDEIYISSAKDSFFLVKNKEIIEYNYQNLLNIFKSKTVELFGYTIVNPLTVKFQLSTGNLIIKTSKAQDFYLNIFRPSTTQHDTFYLAISVLTLKDDPQFTISVAEDDAILLSINHSLLQAIHKIEKSPLLVFNPKFDEKTYFYNAKVSVIVKSQDDQNNQVTFKQNVRLVNTFSSLSVKNANYTISTNSTKSVEFPVEAVYGQNILTTLKTFYVTEGNVYLKALVQQLPRKKIVDYKINYGYSKDKDTFYLQAKNTLLIGTNLGEDFSYRPAEYTLSDQYNCFRTDNYKDMFYSICNNGVENQLVLTKCVNKKCQLVNSYLAIPNGYQVIAPYEDYIIVLFYNPLSPQDQDGEYKMYRIIQNDAFYVQKEVMSMNLEFIKTNLNKDAVTFRPSGMTGVGVEISKETYVYLSMVTDCFDELRYNSFLFENKDIQPTRFGSISLKKLLSKQIIDQTLFLSTQVKSSLFEKDVLTVDLVILTSDSGTFWIVVKFKYNKDEKRFEHQQSDIKSTFVKYGDWKVLNYLAVDSSSIGVAYYKDNQVTVGIYQILKESPYFLTTGGNQFVVTNQQDLSPLNFLMFIQTNQLYNSNPNEKGLTKFMLNTNSSIVITEPQKVESQNLTLTFKNDFSEAVQKIALQIIPIDDDDDSSKGLGAVWIVLIVLSSLVVLVLMGYGYYKSQDPNKEEDAQLV